MRWERKITFYALVCDGNLDNCLTYTTSMQEAFIYLDQWSRIKWSDNFKTWCNWSEGESIDSEQSWQHFLDTDYGRELLSSYSVYKIKMNRRQMATMLRIADLTIPVDAPFITALERTNYEKLTKDFHSVLLDKIRNKLHLIDPRDVVECTVSDRRP